MHDITELERNMTKTELLQQPLRLHLVCDGSGNSIKSAPLLKCKTNDYIIDYLLKYQDYQESLISRADGHGYTRILELLVFKITHQSPELKRTLVNNKGLYHIFKMVRLLQHSFTFAPCVRWVRELYYYGYYLKIKGFDHNIFNCPVFVKIKGFMHKMGNLSF